jgi:glutamate-ammonia-ligase adenylyltransferase
MRELMEQERPPKGPWDLKLSPGGLVDIEFAAQFLQLVHAPAGGPLRQSTLAALAALAEAGCTPRAEAEALADAFRLQQNLTQLLKIALPDGGDPASEPPAFRAMLAAAGGVKSFKALQARLDAARTAAHAAFVALVK